MDNKSQTATEYLIILAVVIIIALIVVGALGLIPGLGQNIDTDDLASRTAKIGLKDITIMQTHAEFTVVNNDNQHPIKVVNIIYDGTNQPDLYTEGGSYTGLISPGQSKRFFVRIDYLAGSHWKGSKVDKTLNLTVEIQNTNFSIDKELNAMQVGCVPRPSYCLAYDVNGDGNVTTSDLSFVISNIGAQRPMMDFDCSGAVDAADSTDISSYFLCQDD